MQQDDFSNASEQHLISATDRPRTRDSLAGDLRAIGVTRGMDLIVHTSLRSIGWVVGGAVSLIHALFDAVGNEGTIVMPAQSTDYTDPADWRHPPVPGTWHAAIRESLPPFDPSRTPTRRMGTVPELFRTWPGVLRSGHPSGSFAAYGKNAERITSEHAPQRVGEESPMAELYRLGGHVLLIGVGFDRNTSFHLAEYRARGTRWVRELMPLTVDGVVNWTEVEEIEFANAETLRRIGGGFLETGSVSTGRIGSAESLLFKVRDSVDFAQDWLAHNSREPVDPKPDNARTRETE